MKHDPWFRALARTDDPDPDRSARFMGSDHDADGIGVRVVELTGRPGDVVSHIRGPCTTPRRTGVVPSHDARQGDLPQTNGASIPSIRSMP